MVYGSIDLPILESLAGPTTVGWYTVAYRWVGLPAFFASIVGTAILPSLSSRYESIAHTFAPQANQAIRLVFFVGAPIATGIILVAGDILNLLYPNSGFSNAVPVMRILALHLPLVTVTMMVGTALIASDRQNKWVLVGCLAAALNLGLNFFAIPWSIRVFNNGAIGAAIVTVLTECVMLAGSCSAPRRRSRSLRPPTCSAARLRPDHDSPRTRHPQRLCRSRRGRRHSRSPRSSFEW